MARLFQLAVGFSVVLFSTTSVHSFDLTSINRATPVSCDAAQFTDPQLQDVFETAARSAWAETESEKGYDTSSCRKKLLTQAEREILKAKATRAVFSAIAANSEHAPNSSELSGSALFDNMINSGDAHYEQRANIDGSGSVDIGDLTVLIDHLFINNNPLPNCL